MTRQPTLAERMEYAAAIAELGGERALADLLTEARAALVAHEIALRVACGAIVEGPAAVEREFSKRS